MSHVSSGRARNRQPQCQTPLRAAGSPVSKVQLRLLTEPGVRRQPPRSGSRAAAADASGAGT
jgi:hypothetical protein